MTKRSPYLSSGRLADVLAALQAMAAGQRPEKTIEDWAEELSREASPGEVARWSAVFREHPEFFLVYSLQKNSPPKAALRWRYTNKLYDAKTGAKYTPGQKAALTESEQWDLTTEPLSSDAIATLLKTAIELHSRALEELTASRWLVATLPSFFGALLGAIIAASGAILAALWKAHGG